MLEMSNELQREPQRADLNIRCELSTCLPHPVFVCHVGVCRFISRQSALIAWYNAFNLQSLDNCSCIHLFCASFYSQDHVHLTPWGAWRGVNCTRALSLIQPKHLPLGKDKILGNPEEQINSYGYIDFSKGYS